MFVYLSKKIAIPNGVRLKSLSWNGVNGWIVCGGENGLLKVLKLDSSTGRMDKKGAGGPSNLSMNQTLEGHNGAVVCVCWNENYRKLTTSDQYGLIIVWMLHKGMWFEEMINNRNKSTVRGMSWTADGQRICIIYEDGAVIVGSVDGNRLWGKELNLQLSHVEWSPDGRNILFGTLQCEVFIYNSNGNYLSQLPLYCLDETSAATSIIGLDWYDSAEGVQDANQPTLAIGVENGRLQLMRHEADDAPVLIDTGLTATNLKWATNGSVLALAGSYGGSGQIGAAREVAMVQFYSPYGQHLRTLKVPGGGIQALSWEGGSLRVALAVDTFIYFANIRPDYRWGFFGDTLVAAYAQPERTDSTVLFWNTKTDERVTKYHNKLIRVRANSSLRQAAPPHPHDSSAAGARRLRELRARDADRLVAGPHAPPLQCNRLAARLEAHRRRAHVRHAHAVSCRRRLPLLRVHLAISHSHVEAHLRRLGHRTAA
jgi:WD repeat-containing protein 35